MFERLGEETSLYKCPKCKRKDFQISELSSESLFLQRIHVTLHLNYQPFVCKVSEVVGGRKMVCNEAFIGQNFLKTHLKSEHKLTPNEREISKYSEFHSIPKVQHLIDSTLKKLTPNTKDQSVNLLPGLISSTPTRSREIGENSALNKRPRTEPDLRSETRVGSGQQFIRHSFNNKNCNDKLGPLLEPVSATHRNPTIIDPPQLAPANSISPIVSLNQLTYNQTNIPNTKQVPDESGKGRVKGSEPDSVPNKSEPHVPSVNTGGSGQQSIRQSIDNENSNDKLCHPLLEVVSINNRNYTIIDPPQLAPVSDISPIVLLDQLIYNQTIIPNTEQFPDERGRAGLKGSTSKINNHSNNKGRTTRQSSCFTNKKFIEEGEQVYDIEKILDKRTRKGGVEYYIKWKGYNEKDNTWEPVENLFCADLIAEFHEQRKKKPEEESKPRDFDLGLDAEKIIGSTDVSGELMFLIKWLDFFHVFLVL